MEKLSEIKAKERAECICEKCSNPKFRYWKEGLFNFSCRNCNTIGFKIKSL